MGLFSKVRDAFSFKGVKKVAKKVAKTVKKVAKGVATSTPWGAKLWKEGGRLGKKVMKGIGKLGPVGMIAVQAVLSATGIGAGLAAAMGTMWSSFGATAAAAAAKSSLLGSLGTAVYNGVNYMGGTLGAIGDAISQGASELASGNFSSAASKFGSNISKALSGTSGTTAMNQGIAKASVDTLAQTTNTAFAPMQSTMGANSTESLLSKAAGGPVSGPASAVTASPVTQGMQPPSLLSTAVDAGKDFVKQELKDATKSLTQLQAEQAQPQYNPYYSPMEPLNTQATLLSGPTQSQAVQAAMIKGY